MEQRRLLWIIAAVGVFLLVVLGAALIIYAPATKTPHSIARTAKPEAQETANGWISLAPSAQSVSAPDFQQFQNAETPNAEGTTAADAVTSAPVPAEGFNFSQNQNAGTVKVNDITVHADNATIYAKNTVTTAPEGTGTQTAQTIINNTTTIDLNSPVPPAQITRENAKEVRHELAQKKPEPKRAPEKAPAVAAKPKNEYKPSSKQSAPAKATAKPAAPKKAPGQTQFWVQVSALTSRKSADSARDLLAQHQITADVFTYTNNKNQMFYRVRVGPYTTKTEAEYWRTKIAQIDNFKSTASYVTSTVTEN